MSFKNGNIPWNKGRTGYTTRWKGRKHSEKTKGKISIAHKGKLMGDENPAKRLEVRKKISKTMKKIITRERMIEIRKLVKDCNRNRIGVRGKNHYRWKGEKITYIPLHSWLRRHYGNPFKCEDCGKIGMKIGRQWNIEWSNCDHRYRRVREDYAGRCQSCHAKYDQENNLRYVNPRSSKQNNRAIGRN